MIDDGNFIFLLLYVDELIDADTSKDSIAALKVGYSKISHEGFMVCYQKLRMPVLEDKN